MFCDKMRKQLDERKLRLITTNTPLSTAPVGALVNEVKNVRAQLKHSEAQLCAIRKKLETGTVNIPSDVQVIAGR